jgi:hypothetical protein
MEELLLLPAVLDAGADFLGRVALDQRDAIEHASNSADLAINLVKRLFLP